MVAEGAVDKTVVYQFLEDGPLDGARFRYSNDGGNTWLEGTAEVNGTDIVLDADKAGVLMTIRNAAGQNIQVQAVDTENPNETDNGTWLYARPTAVYKGDYNNVEVTTPYNNGNTMFSASSEGAFGRDVAVRIDSVDGNTVTYSFSTDDGSNWTQGTTSLKPYILSLTAPSLV